MPPDAHGSGGILVCEKTMDQRLVSVKMADYCIAVKLSRISDETSLK